MSDNLSAHQGNENNVILLHEESPGDKKVTTSLARLARLGLGVILVGRDELDNALRRAEEQIEFLGDYALEEPVSSEDTDLDQLRYLAIGAALKLQKSTARNLRRGVRISLRTSGAVLGTIYALTDNPVLRPVRDTMDDFLVGLANETDQALRMGRLQEERSKALAKKTIGGLVDESIGSIAENPQVTNLIKQQLASQSVGITQLLMDSLARYAATADDFIERIIRKILRMKPRSELQESPIAGKPQLMYLPEEYQDIVETK